MFTVYRNYQRCSWRELRGAESRSHYSLSWSRNSPRFFETLRFISAVPRVSQTNPLHPPDLFCVVPTVSQMNPLHPPDLFYYSCYYSHQCLSCSLFPSDFPTKILYEFPIPCMLHALPISSSLIWSRCDAIGLPMCISPAHAESKTHSVGLCRVL